MAITYTPDNKKFVNPYQFIELAKELEAKFKVNYIDHKRNDGHLTGWLDCTLTTLTPIFIPNRSRIFEKVVQTAKEAVTMPGYDFFSYTDLSQSPLTELNAVAKPEPVIPGSEIRGMIRTAYEALTHSCLFTLDDTQILYKRVQWPGEPGRLIKDKKTGTWSIQPCKRYKIKVDEYLAKSKQEVPSAVLQQLRTHTTYSYRDPATGTPKIDIKAFKTIHPQFSAKFTQSTLYITYQGKMSSDIQAQIKQAFVAIHGMDAVVDKLYQATQACFSIQKLRQLARDYRGRPVWFKYDHTNEPAFIPPTVTEIRTEEPRNASAGQWMPGYLNIGEPFETKKHESLFAVIQNAPLIPLSEEEKESFKKNIKLYRDPTVNAHHINNNGEHSGYQDMVKVDKSLVYYNKYPHHNGRYYLSPAAIGREVFHHRVSDSVPQSFHPCTDLSEVCEACALFGLVGKKNAAASRLRFSDAVVSGTYDYDDPQILRELASPKPSAAEFYLQRPSAQADIWNYDYALRWKRNQKGKATNIKKDWEDILPYTPRIRGRKFYWHHANPRHAYITPEEIAASQQQDQEKQLVSKRNVYVRPLKEQVRFTFRIYFTGISPIELQKLLWILEIGGLENDGQKTQAHKLGMGKPLGLGSVQLEVTAIKCRTVAAANQSIAYALEDYHTMANFESLQHYKKQVYADIPQQMVSDRILQQFLEITNFKQARKNVQYPYNFDAKGKPTNTFDWFVGNKQVRGSDGSGNTPVIYKALPHFDKRDEFPELPVYRERQS